MIKKSLILFILLMSASCISTKNNNHLSPRKVSERWLKALQDKDVATLYPLIEPSSKISLENNLKLYLKTVEELTGKNKDIENILELKEEKFLQEFLNWENKISPIKEFNYSISDIQTGSKTSSVTVLIEDKIQKINLVKIDNIWYIKADNLDSYAIEDKIK